MFSACGGIHTASKLLVLTAYFPVLGKGWIVRETTTRRRQTRVQLIGSSVADLSNIFLFNVTTSPPEGFPFYFRIRIEEKEEIESMVLSEILALPLYACLFVVFSACGGIRTDRIVPIFPCWLKASWERVDCS